MLNRAEKQTMEEYEVRMRIKSVGLLTLTAMASILIRSHLAERREVGMFQWFGLSVNL